MVRILEKLLNENIQGVVVVGENDYSGQGFRQAYLLADAHGQTGMPGAH